MSKATLKTADKRYSSLDNDYEMTFNSETQMWACEEEVDLPSVNFNFIPINQLEGHQPQSTVGKFKVLLMAILSKTVWVKQTNQSQLNCGGSSTTLKIVTGDHLSVIT